MAFGKTWNEAAPAGGDNPRSGDDEIRDFKFAIRERLAQDHYFLASEAGDTDIGFHKQVTLMVQASATAKADAGVLYSKNVNAKAELHYMDEDSNDVQITSAGNIIAVPTGAVIMFKGAACPSGYTDITATYDKKSIIADSLAGASPTTGGGAATAGVTGSHTLATAEIPGHSHPMKFYGDGSGGGVRPKDTGDAWSVAAPTYTNSTQNAGGGGGHTHPLSYVGFKLCEKD